MLYHAHGACFIARTYGGQHRRLGVPPETVLQQPRQDGITVRDKARLVLVCNMQK